MTSHLKTREMTSVPLEVKAEGENGTFEGYGAIFGNLDRDGDVVSRGAFSESLKGRMPALLWQHNAKEPIGRFDVVREDEKGLYVKGRLSMEGRGREAYELLRMGALDGLSIGFVTREAARNATTGTRTITKADLMEISLVTFPANELARVSTVKSSGLNLETPRDFERFLRDSGFSRSRAKAITAKGFGCGQFADIEDTVIEGLVLSLKQSKQRVSGDLGLLEHVEPWAYKAQNNRLLAAVRAGKSDSGTARDLLKEILKHGGKQLWDEAAHALKAEVCRQLVVETFIEDKIRRGSNRARADIAPGGRKRFELPLMWSRSGRQVIAAKVAQKSGGQTKTAPKFECRVSYHWWSSKGLEQDAEILSHNNVSASINIGGLSAVDSWARNARLDDLITANRRIAAMGFATRVEVTMDRNNAGPATFEFLKG